MKSLVLLSGGLDSTTLAYMYRDRSEELHAVSFFYGQRHGQQELRRAQHNAKQLRVAKYDIINISMIQEHLKGSALTDPSVKVPYGHYAEDNMKQTVVPNRNMTMLSIASAVAVSRGLDCVATAVHAGDHAVYPDCRPEFIDAFNKAVAAGTEGFSVSGFKVEAPFVMMSKAEIVKLGAELGVDYMYTYSCYEGDVIHCGECGTCIERQEAFDLAEVEDPTKYRTRRRYQDLKREGKVGTHTV